MSGANFQALLNTKAALDHGLVTEEDYNKIKESFLRAQELRSAIDAGLMNEQEIEQVKKDFVAMVAGQGRGGPHGSQNPARAVGGATKSAPPPPPPMSVMGEAKRSAPPPPAVPAAVPAPAQQKRAAPVPAPPPMPPPVAQQQGSNNAQPGMVPSNLPSIGEAKSIQIDGKSMSGIGLSADAVNIFYLVRSKSSYRWVIWKINDAGNEVVIDAVGAPSSTYQDFLTALPENDCRYAIYDYEFVGSDNQTHCKLVFINWAPDVSPVKSKMMYASTKDFFKTKLNGISLEFQGSDIDEISDNEIGNSVRALKRS